MLISNCCEIKWKWVFDRKGCAVMHSVEAVCHRWYSLIWCDHILSDISGGRCCPYVCSSFTWCFYHTIISTVCYVACCAIFFFFFFVLYSSSCVQRVQCSAMQSIFLWCHRHSDTFNRVWEYGTLCLTQNGQLAIASISITSIASGFIVLSIYQDKYLSIRMRWISCLLFSKIQHCVTSHCSTIWLETERYN